MVSDSPPSLVDYPFPLDREEAEALLERLLSAQDYAKLLGASGKWLSGAAAHLGPNGYYSRGPCIYLWGKHWFSLADLDAWREVAIEDGYTPRPDKNGYIYFIEAENGLIKIGYSINPQQRLKFFGRVSPVPLRLIGYFPASPSDEYALHQHFAELRDHAEWFTPSPELLDVVSGREMAIRMRLVEKVAV
jgi:T5orf172 domain